MTTSSGRFRGVQQGRVFVFRGIRYGASTAGRNRFLPPQPVLPEAGVADAVDYGPIAPQAERVRTGIYASTVPDPTPGEDCLRLNIWTSSLSSQSRKPIMVWFHGGGFENGSGSSPWYDGSNLVADGDVVVVTINHRLNVFGFCHLGSGAGEFERSGNVGMLDIFAALRWVRENAERFGGDPDRILIFGQSGGGRKVSLCMAGADARGLFHRAVVQSGSTLRIQVPSQAEALTGQLTHRLGLRDGDARGLQAMPWRRVYAAQREIISEMDYRFSPVMDGHTFRAHPFDPEAPQISADVPMIIGTTRTELSSQLGAQPGVHTLSDAELKVRLAPYLSGGDADGVISVFRASNPRATPSELFFLITSARGYVRDATFQAERKAALGRAPVWMYRLMWRTPVEEGRRFTPHSLCVPLVFSNPDRAASMVGPVTPAVRSVSAAMSQSWTAFAHTGDPATARLPWPAFDAHSRMTMLFDTKSGAVADPHREERLAMMPYPSQQMGRTLHRRDL
ncbi:MAG: carboxylesterase family protein [Phenylobacterium sp.]|nr:carboxylesterase family protein [Phenylobacterium sp.]